MPASREAAKPSGEAVDAAIGHAHPYVKQKPL